MDQDRYGIFLLTGSKNGIDDGTAMEALGNDEEEVVFLANR